MSTGGAANEAQVVISTDFESMKDFIKFTQGGFDDIRRKGKSGFAELGETVTGFARNTLQGVFVGAGIELANSILGPLKRGFGEAIQSAERFRNAVTRSAIAAGEDLKKVGKETEKLSQDTLRTVEDIDTFITGVKGQTGDRKAAAGALPAYSKEARARGVDLRELAPLAGTLQSRWGVRSAEETEAFFNRQRAGAKALGVDPNQAAQLFEKTAGQWAHTGVSADKAARFSTALLRASGGNVQVAQEAGQALTGIVSGRLPYIEKTLQDARLLKPGETLHDDLNRPDVPRALELMHRYQKQRRGQKGLDWVSQLHLPGAAGAIFSRRTEEIAAATDAQRWLDPGQDLADTEARFRATEEGQSEREERRLERESRRAGAKLLQAQLGAKKRTSGGPLGWITGPIDAAGRAVGRAVEEWKYGEPPPAAPTRPAAPPPASPLRLGGPPAEATGPVLDPRQQAEVQARANAEEQRRGSPIPVIIRGPVTLQVAPAPTAGQGGQR